MKIICVDIDGSIADLKHRLHFIKGAHKNYDAFFDAMSEDAPIENVIEVVNALSTYYSIVFMSGRPDSHKWQTAEWLEKHVWCFTSGSCLGLYMRKAGDHRSDVEVKEEPYLQFMKDYPDAEILGSIEDRPRIILLQRKLGITTFKERS